MMIISMASTKNPQRLAMRNVSPKGGGIRNAQPADNNVVCCVYNPTPLWNHLHVAKVFPYTGLAGISKEERRSMRRRRRLRAATIRRAVRYERARRACNPPVCVRAHARAHSG